MWGSTTRPTLLIEAQRHSVPCHAHTTLQDAESLIWQGREQGNVLLVLDFAKVGVGVRHSPVPLCFLQAFMSRNSASRLGPRSSADDRKRRIRSCRSSHCPSTVAYNRTVQANPLHQVTVKRCCQNSDLWATHMRTKDAYCRSGHVSAIRHRA